MASPVILALVDGLDIQVCQGGLAIVVIRVQVFRAIVVGLVLVVGQVTPVIVESQDGLVIVPFPDGQVILV